MNQPSEMSPRTGTAGATASQGQPSVQVLQLHVNAYQQGLRPCCETSLTCFKPWWHCQPLWKDGMLQALSPANCFQRFENHLSVRPGICTPSPRHDVRVQAINSLERPVDILLLTPATLHRETETPIYHPMAIGYACNDRFGAEATTLGQSTAVCIPEAKDLVSLRERFGGFVPHRLCISLLISFEAQYLPTSTFRRAGSRSDPASQSALLGCLSRRRHSGGACGVEVEFASGQPCIPDGPNMSQVLTFRTVNGTDCFFKSDRRPTKGYRSMSLSRSATYRDTPPPPPNQRLVNTTARRRKGHTAAQPIRTSIECRRAQDNITGRRRTGAGSAKSAVSR